MSDAALNKFIQYGTQAERLAFVPDPPEIGGDRVKVLYQWYETDNSPDLYVYDFALSPPDWVQVNPSAGATVVVDTDAGLDGDGSGGDPLVVKVDGITIGFNGSGELEALDGGSPGGGEGDPADFNLTGTYASLPAAGTAGRIYIPTNSPYTLLRDNGATWDHYIGGIKCIPPVDGDFSWVNQEDASVDTTYGGIYLTKPLGTQIDLAARVKTAPSAPYTLTVGILFEPDAPTGDSLGAGICVRAGGDGKLIIFGSIPTSAAWAYAWFAMTSPTAISGTGEYDSGTRAGHQRQRLTFLRIVDDNTNFTVYWSYDKVHWQLRGAAKGRTAFLTPTQVGFYVDRDDANGISTYSIHVVHWEET